MDVVPWRTLHLTVVDTGKKSLHTYAVVCSPTPCEATNAKNDGEPLERYHLAQPRLLRDEIKLGGLRSMAREEDNDQEWSIKQIKVGLASRMRGEV